jgi:hypothetical protein
MPADEAAHRIRARYAASVRLMLVSTSANPGHLETPNV